MWQSPGGSSKSSWPTGGMTASPFEYATKARSMAAMTSLGRITCAICAREYTVVIGESPQPRTSIGAPASRRQVTIHERDHSVQGGIEWILTHFRQIDERGAGLEQRLYPKSLLDDVVVRGKHRQWRFQTLEFFLDGVAASGAKRGTGVCREHMLYKSAMHVGQIVRRLAKGEPAAPGAQHVAALGGRPQRRSEEHTS